MMKLVLCIVFSLFAIKWITPPLPLVLFLLTLASFFLDLHGIIPFLSTFFYIDAISFLFVSLSIFITFCMLSASALSHSILKFKTLFVSLTFSLLLILVLSFTVNNFLMFYILFEMTIPLTFALILGWGNQPERNQAGKYLIMYTITSSLPLLLSLVFLHEQAYSLTLFTPHLSFSSHSFAQVWSIFFTLAFVIKLPLYAVHVWLPKAHVEAPVAGSMILAALLLKLGGFGVVRLSQIIPKVPMLMSQVFLIWAAVGGVLAALMCMFQTDVKVLIALSSVAHMALVLTGLMTFSNWGLFGAQSVMIGHGFCSSGLFCAANMIYERSNTRNLMLLKNTQIMLPAFSFWWFLLCIANMASPPSLNLMGEMMSISVTLSWAHNFVYALASLVFLAAVYSLFLFSSTQHGKPTLYSLNSYPLSVREHLLLFLHWSPLNLVFLSSKNLFLSM